MIFLIYCRYRKYHKRLLAKLNEFNQQYDSDKILLYNRIIMGVVVFTFVGCIFAGTVTSALANDQEHNERTMIDRKAQQMIFHVKISPFLSMLVTFYGFFVWLAFLTCYVIITNILSGGFESFNKGLKRKLKCANENSIEKLLQESYTTHLKITENVYLVNNVFEVYTFVMFGLNIPLTMIRGIQKILFGTPTIWTPYNEKTYQIANAFVNHVNQDDLGISLWGFTIISNRLILTTLSLTITYLALLVQMKGVN
uniref:Uncharacterized protein n=1 Tax=Acrobeloides nanus TaxID=290746 RepID=A0A914DX93_9BILA